MSDDTNRDLLYGAKAIASHLGLTEHQVYHLAAQGRLPTFKIGKTLCGRRSTYRTWLADQEATTKRGAA